MKEHINLIVSIIILLLLPLTLRGQRINEFYLYPYNQALFNPASVGSEDKHIISASGQLFSLDGDISNWGVLANYEGNIKKIDSGIGCMFRYKHITATESEITLNTSYNYNVVINNNTKLRIGIRNTFNQRTINFDKYRAINPNDLLIMSGKLISRKGDVTLGALLDIKSTYVGISVSHLLKTTYDSLDNQYRYFYGNIGKKIKVNKKLKIEPSIALLSSDLKYYQFNLNNKFILKDIVIIGVTYSQWLDSNRTMLSIQGGVNISDKVELIGLIYSNYNQYHKISTTHIYEGMVRVKF